MPEGRKTVYSVIIIQAFILVFAVLLGLSLGKAQSRGESSDYQYNGHLGMISEAMNYIRSKYKEEDVDTEKLVYGAIKGMTEALADTYEDPYSQFMDPEMYRDTMDDTSGEFGGLGIEISITMVNDYRRLTVISTLGEDTPAYKAGLMAGDYIVKIDGESTFGITLEKAKKKLRGKPNTKVDITVLREGEDDLIDITITRGLIQTPTVKSKILNGNVGYIKLSQFSDTTPKDVDKVLDDFERDEVKGVILDLRSNPGGTLSAAVDIASDFLRQNQLIVSIRGRDKKYYREYKVKRGASHPWHPLVVLVDEWSASGSEIVVGAIKDHKRGLIVGEAYSTFGKGSVQTIFPLSDGKSGLKLTVYDYYTPAGKNINVVGIEPDIKLTGLTMTPSESRMYRRLVNSNSLQSFLKEAGDNILERLEGKQDRDGEDPDRELFRGFIRKLSNEDIILSENLIKLAISQKTEDDTDEYEYDPVIRFALNHIQALGVLEVVSN
jgi:carboxyl-terminal processing protease